MEEAEIISLVVLHLITRLGFHGSFMCLESAYPFFFNCLSGPIYLAELSWLSSGLCSVDTRVPYHRLKWMCLDLSGR